MLTNLDIDDTLVEAARRAGGHKTKKEAVNAALKEYIRRKQLNLLDAFGQFDFDPAYDYKAERKKLRVVRHPSRVRSKNADPSLRSG
jgi:hypothetical protein